MESKRAKIKRVDDKYMDEEEPWEVSRLPFLHLSVDLPSTPLYADAADKNIIPQVSVLGHNLQQPFLAPSPGGADALSPLLGRASFC